MKTMMVGYSAVLGLFLIEQILGSSDYGVLLFAPAAAVLYKTNSFFVRYF